MTKVESTSLAGPTNTPSDDSNSSSNSSNCEYKTQTEQASKQASNHGKLTAMANRSVSIHRETRTFPSRRRLISTTQE